MLDIIISVAFVWIAFRLNKIEKSRDFKWLYSGIGLAILNAVVFLSVITNRIIGASTAYPFVADLITGTTHNSYFSKIQEPGKWELVFLTGAFISGIVISVFRNWKKYKGNSVAKRLIWSFIGGLILIFGARMAGGCTSGHILSGGIQLSLSRLVFAVFVFAGLLITGKYFYKSQAKVS